MKSNSFINDWEKIVKAKSISGKTEKLESLYLNHSQGGAAVPLPAPDRAGWPRG